MNKMDWIYIFGQALLWIAVGFTLRETFDGSIEGLIIGVMIVVGANIIIMKSIERSVNSKI